MKYTTLKTILVLSAAIAGYAHSADFYVAPDGDDGAAGTKAQPFATLAQARNAARGTTGAHIYLRSGMYMLDETLTLTPEDSGVTYSAFENETPVICGGREITGWKRLTEHPPGVAESAQGKLWVADIPTNWSFTMLAVDGRRLTCARSHSGHWRKWPRDYTFRKNAEGAYLVHLRNKAQLRNLPSNGDVKLVVMFLQYGALAVGTLTDINPEAGTAVWSSRPGRPRTPHETGYVLENALPFLDTPDEWVVDTAAGKLYYWPPDGTMDKKQVLAPKLDTLVALEGADDEGSPKVHDVMFRGVTFLISRKDALISASGVKDCTISANRLFMAGGSAIVCRGYAQRVTVEGNEIAWSGGDGVVFEGLPVGQPNVSHHNSARRNWIHHVGRGYAWNASGVTIRLSSDNTIALNLIEHSPYNLIRIGGMHPKYFPRAIPDPKTLLADEHVAANIPESIRNRIRAGMLRWDRNTIKPFLHADRNVLEHNILVEPEEGLDEGGAIYTWCPGKGNVWRENLVFKSSGMPGSSVLALDDLSEYHTVVGNVVWVNGSARCGTIGMRPAERGNVIKGNIRAAYQSRHRDGDRNVNGIKRGFYKIDRTRKPVYALEKKIMDIVQKEGGWLGDPTPGIPKSGESISAARQRTLPQGSHMTIE